MIIDHYHTIKSECSGEYKEKGSKFIGYASPVVDEVEAMAFLEKVKGDHFKARHHCFAYEIGVDGKNFRYNDDGEPSGTAGRPIYGQIQSAELKDVMIVVVRYFGGTKLGASGLITAYKEAAKLAISNGEIEERFITSDFVLTFDYEHMGNIMNILKSLNLNITDKDFTDVGRVTIQLRKSKIEEELIRLKSQLLNVSPEYIEEETEVDYCQIKEVISND